jgi:uncharacterized RDD family membrane protein YckC
VYSFTIGVVLSEIVFFSMLSAGSYQDALPVRMIVYLVTLAVWWPTSRRLAEQAAPGQCRSPRSILERTELHRRLEVLLPDNITVHYIPASLVRRIVALAIDLVRIAFVAAIWCSVAGTLLSGLANGAVRSAGLDIILTLVPLCYFILFEGGQDGQTFGKRMAGIRVIHRTGRTLSIAEVVIRNALRMVTILPVLIPLELFCLLSSAWGQRLGDLAADSVVVVDPR